MNQFIDTTTASFRTRHLARTEDLHPHPEIPGHHGDSLCRVNNLGGVFDQVRADHWVERVTKGARKAESITRLPLCKRCVKQAAKAGVQ